MNGKIQNLDNNKVWFNNDIMKVGLPLQLKELERIKNDSNSFLQKYKQDLEGMIPSYQEKKVKIFLIMFQNRHGKNG